MKKIIKRDKNILLSLQGIISLKTSYKPPKKGKGVKYKRKKVSW